MPLLVKVLGLNLVVPLFKGTWVSVEKCSNHRTEAFSLRHSGLEENCKGTIMLLVIRGIVLVSGTLPMLCFPAWRNPEA